MKSHPPSLFALSFLLVTPAMADVIVVDDDGPADYADIQTAVDAAVDGDVILVRPGNYQDFNIDDKDLRVLGQDALVAGTVSLTNLAMHRTVVVRGLDIQAPLAWSLPGMTVADCDGAVRVQGCTLRGSHGEWYDYSYYESAAAGARVSQSEDVFFLSCGIFAGYAGDQWGVGPSGLEVQSSRVALYDCHVQGSGGWDGFKEENGYNGGHGCYPQGPGELFASHTTFQGGSGGDGISDYDCYVIFAPNGGDGGHGLVTGSTPIRVLDCTFVGSSGGQGGSDCGAGAGAPGAPGLGTWDDGGPEPFTEHPGVHRRVELAEHAFEGQPSPVTVHGMDGDVVELFMDEATAWMSSPQWLGVTMPELPFYYSVVLGVIPPSGVLETETVLSVPDPKPQDVFAQIRVTDTQGNVVLGSPAYVIFDALGERYCPGAPNSVGSGAGLEAQGSTSLSENDLTLISDDAPAGEFGVYFYGSTQEYVPVNDGFLCVGGALFRLKPPVFSDPGGVFSMVVDFTQPPAGAGKGAILSGSSWNFQLWYRDPNGPLGTGSNFSDAIAVTFWP